MGGSGSGNRWRYGTKSTTDDYRSLDVRRWAREGMLRPGCRAVWTWRRGARVVGLINMRSESGSVVLSNRRQPAGGEWRNEEYPVRLVRTACNLGGSRPWFLCPATGCGRRVAILYGGAIFACRQCHKLAFASAREDAGDRAPRKADRLRERLGWEAGILNGRGSKPKWMRWRTFWRLFAAHNQLESLSLSAMVAAHGILYRSVSDTPIMDERNRGDEFSRNKACRSADDRGAVSARSTRARRL